MKKYAALFPALILVFTLGACAADSVQTPAPTPDPTIQPTPEQTPEATPEPVEPDKNNLKGFYEGLVESGLMPEATELTPQIMDGYYEGFSELELNQCTIYIPTFNLSAEEIALIEVEDSEDMETVVEVLAKRKTNLESTWKDYLPDQYELVKNAKIVQNGSYIMFVASEHADEVETRFNNLFEK